MAHSKHNDEIIVSLEIQHTYIRYEQKMTKINLTLIYLNLTLVVIFKGTVSKQNLSAKFSC